MSAYSDNLNALSNQIVFYYLVTTTPISMTTKLISFYIYTRPNLNNKTNTGFLYLLFSIVNSIGLFAMLFVVRSNILFGYQFKFVCGIDDFIRTNLFNFSSWLQVKTRKLFSNWFAFWITLFFDFDLKFRGGHLVRSLRVDLVAG